MTRSIQSDGEERFWYDAADNRTGEDLHPVWDNLLKRLEGIRWEYDGFGRMTDRRGDTVLQGAFTAWGRTKRESSGVDLKVP